MDNDNSKNCKYMRWNTHSGTLYTCTRTTLFYIISTIFNKAAPLQAD